MIDVCVINIKDYIASHFDFPFIQCFNKVAVLNKYNYSRTNQINSNYI